MIRLAFRLDDPSLTSDHALERGILECFRSNGAPLTCAVVPFLCDGEEQYPLTTDAVPHLLDAHRNKHIEVALHGYCHRALARLSDGNNTEFSGIKANQQSEALARGKARIEEIFQAPVSGFVPPWNSYDGNTLASLDELGFDYVSADWALVTETPPSIRVLPHTCNLVHLREAVAEARQFSGLDPVIIVILHHFDFTESGSQDAGNDLVGLDGLLAWVADQRDLRCTTLNELARKLLPDRCVGNLRLARWRHGLHWRLQRLLPRYTMLDADGVRLVRSLGTGALRRLPQALTV